MFSLTLEGSPLTHLVPHAKRIAFRVLAPAFLFSCAAFAQQAEPAMKSQEAIATDTPLLQLSSKLVLLDAVVTEKKSGRVVPGLRLQDFTLREDGTPQTLRYISRDSLPLSLVLLFDLTGSVQPQLQDLAAAAGDLLTHLRPQDEAAVLTFSSSTQLLQPFTKDRGLIATAIKLASTQSTKDGTFIDEDVFEAADLAVASEPGTRRILLFFTDGTSNSVNKASRKYGGKNAPAVLHTRVEAEERLLKNGVSVAALIDKTVGTDIAVARARANLFSYVVGMNPQVGEVARYATLTGGPVVNGGTKDAAEKLSILLDQIHQRYTLGYSPTEAHPVGTLCHLTLELRPEALAAHPELKPGSYVIKARTAYYR